GRLAPVASRCPHTALFRSDGELSDVGPEVPYDRLPFGRELFAPRRDDPVGLLPGAGEHVLPDALGVGRCFLPDPGRLGTGLGELDRKSTRLNSSHAKISYA